MPSAQVMLSHDFEFAEKFRRSVQEGKVVYGDTEINLTVSCGVASMVLKSIESIPKLIRSADEALYEAKRAGRNCTRLKILTVATKVKHA